MIPLKYNVRNLRVRWVTTLMTVLGTAAVVWCSCLLFGMVDGLQHSLNVSGDPLDLIVLRKGSTNETGGGFELGKALEIAALDGIARDAQGRPLVAGELLNIPVVERRDGTTSNLIVRGVEPASRALRPAFTILPGGRDFEPGKGECVVSRDIAKRFKGAQLGEVLRCGDKESYRVVGLFESAGSAAESEVWVDRKDLERNTAYAGFVNSVQLRAATADDLARLKRTISEAPQFKLQALSEPDYFRNQERSGIFLKVFGTIIAVLLTIGAMFSAANTMFAAVGSRTREIGTMRALGFSRSDILVSFLGESLLLCALGGLLGLAATIPLRHLTFGMSGMDSFSELTIDFRLGPTVLLAAAAMTAAMGLFGGLFPAIRAVRMDIVTALRTL